MMKAIISHDYGTYQNLKLAENYPNPQLNELPDRKILVKTLAVSLAPGDARVLSGACRALNGPKSFPYIPGGDLCGTVIDMNGVDPSKVGYNKGDRIASRFTEGPRGALGELALVSPAMTGKVPDNISSEEAAALASSATIALSLSKRISSHERVLIIGAGGGVGSHLCQFLKLKGIKYMAGVSREPERLLKEPILCDSAFDYRNIDVYNFLEWKKVNVKEKFDTVVDLAGGGWLRLLEQSVKDQDTRNEIMIVRTAKEGGRYLTTTPDEPIYELSSIWGALKLFLFSSLFRAIISRVNYRSKVPAYTYAMSLDNDCQIMEETLKLASESKLEACIDSRGPFPFTTSGAQEAFKLQASRHISGKVIIRGPEADTD